MGFEKLEHFMVWMPYRSVIGCLWDGETPGSVPGVPPNGIPSAGMDIGTAHDLRSYIGFLLHRSLLSLHAELVVPQVITTKQGYTPVAETGHYRTRHDERFLTNRDKKYHRITKKTTR